MRTPLEIYTWEQSVIGRWHEDVASSTICMQCYISAGTFKSGCYPWLSSMETIYSRTRIIFVIKHCFIVFFYEARCIHHKTFGMVQIGNKGIQTTFVLNKPLVQPIQCFCRGDLSYCLHRHWYLIAQPSSLFLFTAMEYIPQDLRRNISRKQQKAGVFETILWTLTTSNKLLLKVISCRLVVTRSSH